MSAQTYALVTGASRGIGLEFTKQLLARGHHVFACSRAPGRSEELASLDQGALTLVPMNVSDPASIEEALAAVAAKTDRLDVVVNNAGINSMSKVLGDHQRNLGVGALEPTGMIEMIRVNAIGPTLVTQAALPLLEAAKGRVLNVSSWFASIERKSPKGNYGYCVSKAALNMLGRALALELAPRGVLVLMLNPGWVRTSMGGPNAKLSPEESVRGMLEVLREADMEQTGGFFDHDGAVHPW